MKLNKFRKVYESKVMNSCYIPTIEEFEKYEEDIKIEVAEKDGCKIEFILKSGSLIGGLCTDEFTGMEDDKMDMDNLTLAYSDFDKWLNS